jgi:flagellar hook-associated protein 2
MAVDALTTSGINSLVESYTKSQTTSRVDPLTTKKTKYSNLSSAYTTISSKLSSLKSSLADLKETGESSAFNTKTATASDSTYVTATSDETASVSSYQIRVNQLAKEDTVVSSTLSSTDTSSITTGVHTLKIQSGDYTSNVTVDMGTSTLTNAEAMAKIQSAINSDKAVVQSSSVSGTYTGASGSFTIDLNTDGSTSNGKTTVTYNSGDSYSDIIDSIATQLKDVTGLTAEKVTNSDGTYKLQLTATDSSKYITVDQSTDTGNLLNSSNLNINVDKEMGASGLSNVSVFSPSTGTSKLTLTAAKTGYDNKLVITSDNAFDSIGLTSDILTNRYKNTDDGATTNDTKAGFTLGTQYKDASGTVKGTAETSTSNNLNAKIEFNGMNLQRNSNSIDDLATGVTFSLNSTMSSDDTTTTISVKTDTASVKSEISGFIDKFNDVYTYIKESSASADGVNGVLHSDSIASSVLNMLSSVGYSKISGISAGNISQLSAIGISFSSDTGLTISDSTTLEDAIKDKPDQVAALFNSTNGIATTLTESLKMYLGSAGTIAQTKSSYDDSVTTLSDKIDSVNTSIDKSAEILRNKYQALQTQLATLLSNESSLLGTDSSSTISSLFS